MKLHDLIYHTSVADTVDAARNGIKTGGSQHVGTAIPTDVLDRVEFVGDAWNGRCNNSSILLACKLDM